MHTLACRTPARYRQERVGVPATDFSTASINACTLPRPSPQNAFHDRLILESEDFRRSIDYLVSRPEVDRERLGVYGLSRGAVLAPVLAVDERRLKGLRSPVSVYLPTGVCCPKTARFVRAVSRSGEAAPSRVLLLVIAAAGVHPFSVTRHDRRQARAIG